MRGLFTRVGVIWRMVIHKQVEQNPSEDVVWDGQMVVLVRFAEDGTVYAGSWKQESEANTGISDELVVSREEQLYL